MKLPKPTAPDPSGWLWAGGSFVHNTWGLGCVTTASIPEERKGCGDDFGHGPVVRLMRERRRLGTNCYPAPGGGANMSNPSMTEGEAGLNGTI